MIRTQLRRLLVSRLSGSFSCLFFFAACIALSEIALASPIVATGCGDDCPPVAGVIVTVTGVNPDNTMEGRSVEFVVPVKPDNTFGLTDARSPGEAWSLTRLNVSGNIDPFTSLNYAITNNAAVTLLFTVSVTLPIAPQLPATLHGGSMGGTLTDANFNGVATVATSGGIPFYRGQIDGVTALSIYPDPYSLSVAFPGQTINVPALNPGLPGPTLPSGPAFATIGIINRFTLTAGDQFSGNSFFIVVPVPEPNTLALLGLCLMGFAGRRRR